MKDPVVRYSPVGAVFDTWCAKTHHADDTALCVQATDLHTANAPASCSARGLNGTLSSELFTEAVDLERTMQEDAPLRSAWT